MFIKPIITEIYKKDLMSLYAIKEIVYKLLLINIKPKQILKEVMHHLLKTVKSDKQQLELLEIASDAEHKMCIVHYNII